MNNLFTPEQVKREHLGTDWRDKLLSFDNDSLFEITVAKVQSLEDQRRKMTQWFKKMSPQERQHELTHKSKQFVCLVRKMHQISIENPYSKFCILRDQNLNYYLKVERSFPESRQAQSQASQKIIDEVILINRHSLYDCITLSEKILLDVDQLFLIFETVQEGVFFELTLEDYQAYQIGSHVLFYEQEEELQPKTLGRWIVDVLLKQACLSFLNEDKKSKEKQIEMFKQQSKNYSNIWREQSEEDKNKIINNALQNSIKDLLNAYVSNINVINRTLPRLIISDQIYVSQHKNLILNANPKQIYQLLTQTSLGQQQETFNMFKMQILLQIVQRISEKEEEIRNKKKKLNKKKKQKKTNNKLEKTNKQIQQIKTETLPKQTIIESKINQKDSEDQKQTQQQPDQSKQETIKQELQETNTKLAPNLVKQLYKNISQNSREGDRSRKIIFNRIIYILGGYNLTCKLYGSFACDLTLRDSDLDISIDSTILTFFLSNSQGARDQVVKSLQFLSNIFQNTEWADQFTLLPNATVPLLSFRANPAIYYQHGQTSKLRLNLKSKEKQGAVKVMVDVTVQPLINTFEMSPHLGFQSTSLTKQWLNQFPVLQNLILILKYLLRKQQLHKAYTGGISSFGITVLLVGFLKYKKPLEMDINDGECCIDLQSNQILTKYEGEKIKLINPCQRNRNLLQNSYRWTQIRECCIQWIKGNFQ